MFYTHSLLEDYNELDNEFRSIQESLTTISVLQESVLDEEVLNESIKDIGIKIKNSLIKIKNIIPNIIKKRKEAYAKTHKYTVLVKQVKKITLPNNVKANIYDGTNTELILYFPAKMSSNYIGFINYLKTADTNRNIVSWLDAHKHNTLIQIKNMDNADLLHYCTRGYESIKEINETDLYSKIKLFYLGKKHLQIANTKHIMNHLIYGDKTLNLLNKIIDRDHILISNTLNAANEALKDPEVLNNKTVKIVLSSTVNTCQTRLKANEVIFECVNIIMTESYNFIKQYSPEMKKAAETIQEDAEPSTNVIINPEDPAINNVSSASTPNPATVVIKSNDADNNTTIQSNVPIIVSNNDTDVTTDDDVSVCTQEDANVISNTIDNSDSLSSVTGPETHDNTVTIINKADEPIDVSADGQTVSLISQDSSVDADESDIVIPDSEINLSVDIPETQNIDNSKVNDGSLITVSDLSSDSDNVPPTINEEVTTKERNNMNKNTFGLPSEEKYPMPDLAHLKSAITYFHKETDPKKQKELAKNIIRRTKELHAEGKIHVSSKNSLYNYVPNWLKDDGGKAMNESIDVTDNEINNNDDELCSIHEPVPNTITIINKTDTPIDVSVDDQSDTNNCDACTESYDNYYDEDESCEK